jgi:hypothetical protein
VEPGGVGFLPLPFAARNTTGGQEESATANLTQKRTTARMETHKESLKRERSIRLGETRAKIPNDIHSWLSPFATSRSYSRMEDAIWYLLRCCALSFPLVEKVTVQVSDNERRQENWWKSIKRRLLKWLQN